MRVLALDIGSSCGFALGGDEAIDASGVWQLAPGRGESPGMRYVRLRALLEEVLRGYPDIGLVAYEAPHHRGGAATEYGVGCSATVQAWAAERGLEHTAVHSAKLKKWATGRGNAPKSEMLRRGRERFKPSTTTDDEMDALWLLSYANALYRPTAREV